MDKNKDVINTNADNPNNEDYDNEKQTEELNDVKSNNSIKQSDKSSSCIMLPSVPNTCTRQFCENVLIKTNMNIYIYI